MESRSFGRDIITDLKSRLGKLNNSCSDANDVESNSSSYIEYILDRYAMKCTD